MEPVLLAARGEPDGRALESAVRRGLYEAVARARAQAPEAVLAAIKRSNLRGRGGAGFPTGLKWQFARDAARGPRYVVCNADESEPGTFKDREIIRCDPHQVLAGVLIACHVVEAAAAVIYIRGEYVEEAEILRAAIQEAREAGELGEGTPASPEVHLYRGAGAYVCGEETALLDSVEGRRGTPRVRPPFPAAAGLLGRPTVINNVETLSCVPWIVLRGPEWFASIGRPRNAGPKLFSISGAVVRPGVYEAPLGTPFAELIFERAGGLAPGRRLKAFCPGGVATRLLPAAAADAPADFDGAAAAGSALGSGAIIVMDDRACMVDVSRTVLEFMVHESCGTCVPCRIGTLAMLRLLKRIAAGEGTGADLERLRGLAEHVPRTSLCGLGQASANVLASALELFGEEFRNHLAGGCGRCREGATVGGAA